MVYLCPYTGNSYPDSEIPEIKTPAPTISGTVLSIPMLTDLTLNDYIILNQT
jgi:hypothetical protein